MNRKQELFLKQGRQCHWCGTRCHMKHPPGGQSPASDQFTEDHVVPRSRGGRDTSDNVVGACRRCNDVRNQIETKLLAGQSIEQYDPAIRTKLAPVHFVVKGKR